LRVAKCWGSTPSAMGSEGDALFPEKAIPIPRRANSHDFVPVQIPFFHPNT
jgi:hypothetical protein